MKKDSENKNNTLLISGGIMTMGAIITAVILRNWRKGTKAQLPPNFRNWHGGNTYLQNMVRGIRNNNPGNVVRSDIPWKGKVPKNQSKDGRFEMFIAPEYGVRAMIKDLKHDIEKGNNTVPKLIREYSPPFENNTEKYISTVCKDIKVSRTAVLLPTKRTLKALVFSMTRVETGGNYVTNALFEKAYSLI